MPTYIRIHIIKHGPVQIMLLLLACTLEGFYLQKQKPPGYFQEAKKFGGGGGNRTRVRKNLCRYIYVLIPKFNLALRPSFGRG